MAAARRWAAAQPTEGSVAKSERVARRLPPEALPFMVEILAEGTDESLAAFSALYWNGATVESDATDDTDATWYRVTLPDGTVLERRASSQP